MKHQILGMVAAACMSSLAIAPASAEELQVNIDYSDLDIASAAGKQALASRIDTALDRVCERPEAGNLMMSAEWQACRDQAKASVADQLDRAGATALAATYTAKGRSDQQRA